MDFALSDEHQMLRDTSRAFLDAEVDLAPLLVPGASVAAAPYRQLGDAMAELGWCGVIVPEPYGGLGMSHVDLAMILEQLGRTLAPSPMFGTLAGTWALLAAGSVEQKQRILPEVAAGAQRLALAAADPTGEVGLDWSGVTARRVDDRFLLSGTRSLVLDADHADLIVVVALVEGTPRYLLVSRDDPALSREALDWRDITRNVCRVTFEGAVGELLPAPVAATWPRIADRLLFVLAAESAGGLQHVLDASVDYAKERIAFGRPIGAYQAIKHSLAEIKGRVECTSAAVLHAAWALDADPETAPVAVRIAQSYASDSYVDAAFRSIQIFGAIGFTWEMRNHLYLKRARANAELLGSSARQRDEIFTILHARQLAAGNR